MVWYFPKPVELTQVSLKNMIKISGTLPSDVYVGGSKSFRPDIQKPRQMENAVRDI